MTQNLFDQLRAGAETLGTADLYDKAELVGRELVITSARFHVNERDVEYVYCEAVTADGQKLEFNDSSKAGIRGQVATFLEKKGVEVDPKSEEIHDVKIWAPRGLRVSTFDVLDSRGKTKQAKTYYLTSTKQ